MSAIRRRLHRAIGGSAILVLLAGCADWTQPTIPPPPEPEEPVEPPPEPVAGPSGIYLANADGSNPRYLTDGAWPAWSPDGRNIAFVRDGIIRVIAADGTGEAPLGAGDQPAWTPDGARLAFVSDEGISVMDNNGSGAALLLRHDFRDDTYAEWDMGIGKPDWSPDGKHIAFEHLGDGDMMPAQIFVMNSDGTTPRLLTDNGNARFAESNPAWSPDGLEIAFWSYGHGLAVAPGSGGVPRSIYQNFPTVAYGTKPAWSPDGGRILFAVNRWSMTGVALWVVSSQGGTAGVLIPGGFDASWSPDGRTIAFVRVQDAAAHSFRTASHSAMRSK